MHDPKIPRINTPERQAHLQTLQERILQRLKKYPEKFGFFLDEKGGVAVGANGEEYVRGMEGELRRVGKLKLTKRQKKALKKLRTKTRIHKSDAV